MAKTDEPGLTIKRVANGWVVVAAKTAGEVLHIAVTAESLAEYVAKWAKDEGGTA